MKINELRKILNKKLVEFYDERCKSLELLPASDKSMIERKIVASFRKDNYKFNVAVEFDKGNPSFGIYYGCFIEKLKTDDVLNVVSSWKTILKDISQELQVVTIMGDLFVDKTYWPFWIRVEECESIENVNKNLLLLKKYFTNKNYNKLT